MMDRITFVPLSLKGKEPHRRAEGFHFSPAGTNSRRLLKAPTISPMPRICA